MDYRETQMKGLPRPGGQGTQGLQDGSLNEEGSGRTGGGLGTASQSLINRKGLFLQDHLSASCLDRT